MQVYAKPNLGLASFSVKTEGKTVVQVMSENTKNMNAVIEVMKGLGVEEKDLKTTEFNIYPRYEYQENGILDRNRRVLAGYDISQSLQVKIRDLDKAGQIIQGATNAGANQVNDLIFTFDDEELGQYEDQVREIAIKKAKSQANQVANQLGVDLVRIISFNEQAYSPRSDFMSKEMIGIGGGGGMPQIETGENKIETTVYITYEIN